MFFSRSRRNDDIISIVHESVPTWTSDATSFSGLTTRAPLPFGRRAAGNVVEVDHRRDDQPTKHCEGLEVEMKMFNIFH